MSRTVQTCLGGNRSRECTITGEKVSQLYRFADGYQDRPASTTSAPVTSTPTSAASPSPDPSGLETNPYASGDPTNRIDPSGGLFDAGVEWRGGHQFCLVSAACVSGQVVVTDVDMAQERDADGGHVGFNRVDETGFGFRVRQFAAAGDHSEECGRAVVEEVEVPLAQQGGTLLEGERMFLAFFRYRAVGEGLSNWGAVAGGEHDEVVHELAVRPGRAAHEDHGVEVAASQPQCVAERVVVMGEDPGFGGRSRPWGVLLGQQPALIPAFTCRPQQGAAVPGPLLLPLLGCPAFAGTAGVQGHPYGLYSFTSSTRSPCRAHAAANCTASVPSS